jgi:ABC-type transporter Mla maintaining outer membrane lipid asymmetry permease subunit MlaE
MLRATISEADIGLTLLKGSVMGIGVAVLPAMEGLEAGDNPTNIPIAVSRGTVQAFLWVLAASAGFAVLRFVA